MTHLICTNSPCQIYFPYFIRFTSPASDLLSSSLVVCMGRVMFVYRDSPCSLLSTVNEYRIDTSFESAHQGCGSRANLEFDKRQRT